MARTNTGYLHDLPVYLQDLANSKLNETKAIVDLDPSTVCRITHARRYMFSNINNTGTKNDWCESSHT